MCQGEPEAAGYIDQRDLATLAAVSDSIGFVRDTWSYTIPQRRLSPYRCACAWLCANHRNRPTAQRHG